jgi:acyl-CoA thioesterase-2
VSAGPATEDTSVLGRLVALLDLERVEVDIFRGANPGSSPGRVFGGQVAAQALRAAGATVDADHRAHSLHSYFLRPGRPGVPIVYRVERIRDGRSFTTRRVVAIQHGEAIFNLDASFQRDEEGLDHEIAAPGGVPDPESLDRRDARGWHHGPMDERDVPDPVAPGDGRRVARQVWVRAAGTLPDDPALHACVTAYLSDMGPTGHPHLERVPREAFMNASLDHAMWFHRAARADEWLLYTIEPVSTSGGRGLAWGTMHTRAGRLAVVMSQEVLLRTRR